MIDGMSEICIDCIHQEVCRYECHCPSEHCNDYSVADDFRPHGKWIEKVERRGCFAGDKTVYSYTCPFCGVKEFKKYPFCHCGADMRGNTDMRNKKKETTFDDYLKEQLKDPEFMEEWERLQDEDVQEGGKEDEIN